MKKTKMMLNVVGAELNLGDDVVERVDRFVFLGSRVDMKTGCRDEIKRRLAMGRATIKELEKIWRNRDITKSTKQLLLEALYSP